MTRIRYGKQRGEDGRERYVLTAQGHATGSTEFCAAISGILYSLAGYLVNEKGIQVDRCKMEPGNVELQAQGGIRAETAYEMAVMGLKQLEKSDPKLVKVTKETSIYKKEE